MLSVLQPEEASGQEPNVIDMTSDPIEADLVESGSEMKEDDDPIDLMDQGAVQDCVAVETAMMTSCTQTGVPAKKALLLANWLKSSEALRNHYQWANGGIRLRGRFGFRGHPATIEYLAHYFRFLAEHMPDGPEDGVVLLPSTCLPLIAALLEESTVLEPAVGIQEILLPHCVPGLEKVTLQFEISGSPVKYTLCQTINLLGGICFYGPSDVGRNVKSKNACLMWQVQDLGTLPPAIGKLAQGRRVMRQLLAAQLNLEYKQLFGIGEPVVIASSILALASTDSISIGSAPSTPRKGRGRPAKDVTGSAKSAVGPKQTPKGPPPNQKQLSSFFTVVKKPSLETSGTSAVYFQPFHLKEGCTLAPINYFSDYQMMAEEDTQVIPTQQEHHRSFFWSDFRRHAKKSPVAWRGKQQASCMAWDRGSVYFPLKLLQFHENFRPAYFGSMRNLKVNRFVNGRRPFAMDPSLDYEYDSDDDWCEEVEVGDAESILTEDDDDEDDDDEDEDEDEGEDQDDPVDHEENGDEWLIQDGPVSDVPTFKRQSYKKGQKKRYIHLQPLMFGPYYGDSAVVPDIIRNYKARTLGTGPALPLDPFLGVEPVREEKTVEPAPAKVPFPESSLPDLAQLAHGSTLGVAKLYDLFIPVHGRVSKKQFELRLNQIAEKTKQTGRSQWTVRQEYQHLLASPSVMNSEENMHSLTSQVADVVMSD